MKLQGLEAEPLKWAFFQNVAYYACTQSDDKCLFVLKYSHKASERFVFSWSLNRSSNRSAPSKEVSSAEQFESLGIAYGHKMYMTWCTCMPPRDEETQQRDMTGGIT